MKYLRKFNESFQKPGPNVEGSKKITISEEDTNLFNDESILQKLIADEKVSLIGNEIYYNDEETLEVLNQYFK